MVFIDSKNTDASFNFALEKYLMYNLDIADAYFLFWRTSPTVMIGKFQNTDEEVNMDFIKRNHINVVRRITGGGTVYTDMGGWQFSYITKQPDPGEISFLSFTAPIREALKNIGVNAYNSGRNDLLIYGKKISGNAQFKSKDVVLHHGTLLFNSNLDQLAAALNNGKMSGSRIKSAKDRVSNISTYMIESMTSEAFRDILLDQLIGDMTSYTLKKQDIKKINQIKAEQFDSWDWNFGKPPKSNVEKEKVCAGGILKTKTHVKNDLIHDIHFYGDFFEQGNLDAVRSALIGCSYNKTAILNALDDADAANCLYHITQHDILETII